MELLKRRPVLSALGILATLEWVALWSIYLNMSYSDQIAIQMSPTMMIWATLLGFAFCAGMLVMLVCEVVPSLRTYTPFVIGALLALAVVAGILMAAMAAHPTCGCEPS